MSEVPLYRRPSYSPTLVLGWGRGALSANYRGTSLIRNRQPPRTTIGPSIFLLWGPRRGLFLVNEVPVYPCRFRAKREVGNLLPNNRRQRRTCYALCHILYTPCRPLIRAFSGWIRTPLPTSERNGNTSKGLSDCYLKTKARLWPWLSHVCHIR